jgi:hypothetical protein
MACLQGSERFAITVRERLDHNATVANYNDQVLLYTILRARDEAPINILTLSTITVR